MISKEVKIKIEDLEGIIKRLLDIGVRSVSSIKEMDHYFDNSSRTMQSEDKVLRLRQFGNKTLFSYQSPLRNQEWNERETIETDVQFSNMMEILKELGFVNRFVVEKVRRKFYFQGLRIFIDNVPFLGHFLELHGHENKIRDMLERLRLKESEIIRKNYIELFQEFVRENNIPVENTNELTFSNETRHVKTNL